MEEITTYQPKTKNAGGNRKGAGRPRSPHKMCTVYFRVREEWREEFTKSVKEAIRNLEAKADASTNQ